MGSGRSCRNPPPPLPAISLARVGSVLGASGRADWEGGMNPWFRPGEEALETELDLIWSHTNSSSATSSRASRVVDAY